MSTFLAFASRYINIVDAFTRRSGECIAWLLFVMVLIESLIVLLRYGFDIGSIAAQESVIYINALCFLLGAAYTLQFDEHVRVDIFYRTMSETKKAWVNLVGFLLFLLPVCLFIIFTSIDYVAQSWSVNESSSEADGLPGVYLFKSLIPVFAMTLILQGAAEALRSLLTLLSTSIPQPDIN